MIPVTAVIPLLGPAIKLLTDGRGPGGEWGGQVTNILSALLAQGEDTNTTLTRIEEKLDRLTLQSFQHSFGSALNLLEEASPARRDPLERERLIAEARNRLSDALASAPDPLSKGVTEWYLGLAWLLSRSAEDCDRAMRRAADAAFAALLEVAQEWSSHQASAELDERSRRLDTGFGRFTSSILGSAGGSTRATLEARKQLRQQLVPHAQDAEGVFLAIQRTREALGTDPEACLPARLAPAPTKEYASSRKDQMNVIVDLNEGDTARVGALEVGIPALRVLPSDGSRWTLVDTELVFACEPGEEAPLSFGIVALTSAYIAYTGGPGRGPYIPSYGGGWSHADGSAYLNSTPNRAGGGPSLPGPSILADGSFHPYFEGLMSPNRGVLELIPGQSARGWLRLACAGEPVAIAIDPPDTRRLYFLRRI
jgi:hypothetical protein